MSAASALAGRRNASSTSAASNSAASAVITTGRTRTAIYTDTIEQLRGTAGKRQVKVRAETGIAYDERAQGTLQLFRTQKQLDGIGKDIEPRVWQSAIRHP